MSQPLKYLCHDDLAKVSGTFSPPICFSIYLLIIRKSSVEKQPSHCIVVAGKLS